MHVLTTFYHMCHLLLAYTATGNVVQVVYSIINHTLLSTIRAVIGTLTCTSMVSNSTSNVYTDFAKL